MNHSHPDDIEVIELKSETGLCVEIITLGAIITKIMALDKSGIRENVVLSYEVIEDYRNNLFYLGCVIGPVAGRTFDGQVRLQDQILQLDTSCHPNSLHSCEKGLHKVNWLVHSKTSDTLVLTHSAEISSETSGYLNYTLTYKVLGETLTIYYHVTSTELTYLSLTNHSYFNLSGNPSTPITGHQLQLNCSHFARLDESSLPTELIKLDQSVFDFSKSKLIGDVVALEDEDVKKTVGIDHPFKCSVAQSIAELSDPVSGRIMRVATTQPYVVIYSGNFLDAAVSDSGKRFVKHAGICFETQDLPNLTRNKLDDVIYVSKSEPYRHETRFEFSTL